jgi:protoporphyrin/coproporphyrin ferrochelatase
VSALHQDGPAAAAEPYDALLLVSFGGPEAPDEVMPYLERVTRGRGVPRERLLEVAEHYYHFGGRSPINDQNRALLAALRTELDARGLDIPLHWGNRNSDPLLPDTVEQMRRQGVQRVAAFVTSAYSSYSGCRQYRENLAAAVSEVGEGAPRLDKLRHYFDHPGFVTANADALRTALDQVPEADRGSTCLAFVTHSIPDAMQDSSGPHGGAYTAQHRAAAAAIVAEVAASGIDVPDWDLVYCSRSGPPSVPWLEPDVNDYLADQAHAGRTAAVLAPIGFVSDHMEVVFDLDTEARETADELGLSLVRAATAGVHPAFVAMVVDLLLERAAVERGEGPARPACSPLGPSHDVCPAGCCRNLRAPLPALCGSD